MEICLFLMAFMCLCHLGYLNINKQEFIVDLKFFACVFLGVAILLFEKAYKKDNTEFVIYGIEMFIMAVLLLFLPYIYFYSSLKILIIFVMVPFYWGIYYCGKSIVIEYKMKKQYYKNISDVKEITKKERKK